jgi:hypothetical protein
VFYNESVAVFIPLVSIWQRRKSENPTVSLKDGKLNEHDFNKLPYQIYRGLDYGLSAKTALVCMKFDGDENYLKRNYISQMNEMKGSLADEFII